LKKLFLKNKRIFHFSTSTMSTNERAAAGGVKKESKWIRLGDQQYNVTHFKHPGGSVINYMEVKHTDGADAQHVFDQFHLRSVRAHRILKALPKKPFKQEGPEPKDQAMMEDFVRFTKELQDEGYFDGNWIWPTFRIIELCVLFLAGCYLVSIGRWLSGAAMWGLFGGRNGWVQHEGGHNSLTGIIWLDKRIQEVTIGFGLLTSAAMWNSMHNKHHACPQKVKHDMDLDTMPLVAFYFGAAGDTKRGISLWWTRFQHLTFLPITSGMFVMVFWIYYLHPRKIIRDKAVFNGVMMLLGHIVRTMIVKSLCPGSGWAFAYFAGPLLSSWFAGMYLFGHFSTSHTFLPVVEENENKSWVRYAVEHTIDINPSNHLVSWIMGYLNCQVIHHLYPNMPQWRGPDVSRRFQVFCKKWDLNYQVLGYWEAWHRMFSNLLQVGSEYWEAKGDDSKAAYRSLKMD